MKKQKPNNIVKLKVTIVMETIMTVNKEKEGYTTDEDVVKAYYQSANDDLCSFCGAADTEPKINIEVVQ